MSDKNQYKINDKLEQRVKANEDKIVALGNDIEAIIKVLTKMKKELYYTACLLYTSPSPRDSDSSRMPSSA